MSSLHSQLDSHILHEGYLSKKGKYNTSFQRRYFKLYDDRTIDYFKDSSQSSSRSKAKGTIHLTQIKRVELVEYEDGHPKIIELDLENTNKDKIKLKMQNNIAYFNNDSNVISSYRPPPEYKTNNNSVITSPDLHSNSNPDLHNHASNPIPRTIKHHTHSRSGSSSLLLESKQRWNSIGSECILSDEESKTYENKC
eukprot:783071_1